MRIVRLDLTSIVTDIVTIHNINANIWNCFGCMSAIAFTETIIENYNEPLYCDSKLSKTKTEDKHPNYFKLL